ncbi:MAG: hypothetical protein ACRC5C_00135 [Bacilli bacterium]
MSISGMMQQNVQALRQTVNLSLLNMAKNTQASAAQEMLAQFSQTQSTIHPTSGHTIDLRG